MCCRCIWGRVRPQRDMRRALIDAEHMWVFPVPGTRACRLHGLQALQAWRALRRSKRGYFTVCIVLWIA